MAQTYFNKEMRCIYLTGFMGAGKSSVGKRLAPRLELPYLDLDRLIEEQKKQRISEIFSAHGEAYFRELEIEALKGIREGVIALGGGAFMQKVIRDFIGQSGVVVFLDWPFEVLYRRICNSKHRPLVQDQKSLHELYQRRYPVYQKADLIWRSHPPHRESVKQVVKDIQKKLRNL